MQQIDPFRERKIFNDCFFPDNATISNPIIVEGLGATYGFDGNKLKEYEAEIKNILNLLPIEYKASGGKGHYISAAIKDQTGNTWGSQADCEKLACLGIACKAAYWIPQKRSLWQFMPLSIPLFAINDQILTGQRGGLPNATDSE